MPMATVATTTQDPTQVKTRIAATGGTADAVVKDGSDTTYIRRAYTHSPMAWYRLVVPTIPANNDVATVVPRVRLRQPTGTAPKILSSAMYALSGVSALLGAWVGFPGVLASATTVTTPASGGAMAAPNGASWMGAWATGVGVALNDGHGTSDSNRDYIYELSADVYYAARPTASVTTTPPTPINTTSFPTFNVTVTGLVESWQDFGGQAANNSCPIETKVFSAAQYGAGGFDPSTSATVWSKTSDIYATLPWIDGVTPSSATMGFGPDLAIPNGTYRVYARARRFFTGAQFGAWSYTAFTVSVTPPTAPTISQLYTLSDEQCIQIGVTPNASAGATYPRIWVQRSADGGANWAPVRGATGVVGAFGGLAQFFDYEAPRGVALTYSVRVQAYVSSQDLSSVTVTQAAPSVLPATTWNIKVPLSPALNMIGAQVVKDPDYSQAEEVGVFRPPSRSLPVVISRSMGGADGSLQVRTSTSAEWAALQAIKAYRGVLLLESPFEGASYIRVLGRSWVEYGAAVAARRIVKFDFLEVASP